MHSISVGACLIIVNRGFNSDESFCGRSAWFGAHLPRSHFAMVAAIMSICAKLFSLYP